MTESLLAGISGPLADPTLRASAEIKPSLTEAEVGQKFEELLWAEMLTGAGLEKAMTMNGGQAASSFSRYVVEALAAEIAEKHPLGLSQQAGLASETSLKI